jgi:hypothetical protein
MLTILPTGGLCNYLRVVFSYYKYAMSINTELNVIWLITPFCPGNFLDYFESVPNINFINNVDKNLKIDYKGGKWHPDFNPYEQYIYDKLVLKPFMKEIISDKINKLNKDYISVHIRRTDHINLAKRNNAYNEDIDFINFINKFDKNKNIYIATDNEETYNKFKKMYPNRIKFNYHKTYKNTLRKTSLRDAIIDIYICVYSDEFKGSGYSSFSGTINQLRKS